MLRMPLLSQLGTQQVLAPDAKSRICGMFKGEVVYRRSDVSTAKTAKKWLYDGRKVRENEKPIKRVKARKKSSTGWFPKVEELRVWRVK
jgi:xeroderma pigmentosum group C-complementing protein